MPRAPKQTSPSRSTIRRSSRLNGIKDLKNKTITQQSSKPRESRTKKKPDVQLCNNDILASNMLLHSSNDRRRSQRIATPAELVKRENALLLNEEECKRRAIEIDERMRSLTRKEDEASMMLSQVAEREAKTMIAQLEEHFMCPLCYEVMAYPYTLNPGQCGHTFCAICILKWFFSRLHRACGGWHESVDCPICRSLLIITPDRVPRLEITFPFVPNRTATAVCESLIEKLAKSPSDTLVVKREDTEGVWKSESSEEDTIGCGGGKGKSKEEVGDMKVNADIAGWREGGPMKAEWLKRDRDGKREMNHISKFWTTLGSQDFISLKQRLGV